MVYCHLCGEEYSDELSFCPKCGARNLAKREEEKKREAERGLVQPDCVIQKPLNVMAIVGIVLSGGMITSLAGMIVSIIAYKKAKSGEFRNSLTDLSKTGIVLGAVFSVLTVLGYVGYFVFAFLFLRDVGNAGFMNN